MSDFGGPPRSDKDGEPRMDRGSRPDVGAAQGRAIHGPGRVIDAGRLWAGGVMAGVVAVGVAVVGLLIARGILDIPVLVQRGGQLVTPSTFWYAGMSFLAALGATGLMHVLLAAAPQPYRFFGWILGLAVTIAVLVPLAGGAGLATKVAVAAINLAIGLCIGSIVSGVSRSASRILDEP